MWMTVNPNRWWCRCLWLTVVSDSPRSVIPVRWRWSPAGCVCLSLTAGGEASSSPARRRPASRPTASQISQNSLLRLRPTPAPATACLYLQSSSKLWTLRLPSSPCLPSQPPRLSFHWLLLPLRLLLPHLLLHHLHLPPQRSSRMKAGRRAAHCDISPASLNLLLCLWLHFPLDSSTAASCWRRGRSWGRRPRWTPRSGGEVRKKHLYFITNVSAQSHNPQGAFRLSPFPVKCTRLWLGWLLEFGPSYDFIIHVSQVLNWKLAGSVRVWMLWQRLYLQPNSWRSVSNAASRF